MGPRNLLVTERARPAWVRNLPFAWWLAVGTVCFGAFMGQLDASIVTLTYRPVERAFSSPLAAVQWVSLSYLLTLVALLVPIGRLSDVRGRKLVYLYGFAVFTAGSAACGLAPSLGALVAFRVVQATGAAMLQANSVALVRTSAPAASIRAALGVQAAAQSLGLALGPTVGGLLVGTVGWRWVFAINVPVGVVALAAGVVLLPRTHDRAVRAAWDRWGPVLLAVSAVALLLGLSGWSGLPLPPGGPEACIALAVLAAGGVAWRQRRAAAPMISREVISRPELLPGLGGAMAGYLALFGPLVLVPIVLERHGMSALHAGLVLTALPAGFALGATAGEWALPRSWGDRRRGAAGAVTAVAALAVAAALPTGTASVAVLLAAAGAGLGVFTPANNSQVMRALPVRAAGTAGGLLNMTRGLGTALGVAVVTLALAHSAGAGARVAFSLLAVAAAGSGLSTIRRPAAPHR